MEIGVSDGAADSQDPDATVRRLMPRLSAAVLNFNGRHLLEIVLPSLIDQRYRDFETIVVDNGSTDDSVAYLAEHWPEVRVVVTGTRNVGVSAALNMAVAAAGGELVALLNNDIELDPDWLGELVAALDRHPEAASVAGKLLRFDERGVLDGAGNIFRRSATAWQRGAGQPDRGQYDSEQEVFAATAGAALYRRSALVDVGPFDESFFAYFEDVDWGLRAQISGHRCWYVPSAVAFHMGSRTTRGDADPFYYELQRRNTLALLIKDVPLPFIVRNAPHILAHHALGLAYSARARMLRVHLRAIRAAWSAAPAWRAERRRILGTRQVGIGDFDRFVSDR
ncbi:MAG TPA: glycosyltransferase family 2 protein [Solirubrobacteraceae bacterium]|nr:glycosyltransferase family 2 protein [Solirubrobacteraceae bacterium]